MPTTFVKLNYFPDLILNELHFVKIQSSFSKKVLKMSHFYRQSPSSKIEQFSICLHFLFVNLRLGWSISNIVFLVMLIIFPLSLSGCSHFSFLDFRDNLCPSILQTYSFQKPYVQTLQQKMVYIGSKRKKLSIFLAILVLFSFSTIAFFLVSSSKI